MTQLMPALNKAQSQAKTAAVQGNYATAPQQDSAAENYADLLAGITQQSTQQSEPSEVADTALPSDGAAIEVAVADAALFDITDIVTAELLPVPLTDNATTQQSHADSQTNTVAALNLSYSFAAERSVFYSNIPTDTAAGLNAVAQHNSVAATGQTAAMAALAASAATATATEAQRQAVTEQTLLTQQAQQNTAAQQAGLAPQTVLPLQGTSLQQFIRQALGSVQQQDSSSAAVSGVTATAAASGSTAAGAEAALSWKADLAGLQSSQWGQKLVHLLSDKINLQLGQQIQRAQIRLDPPQLGVIELSVSVDGDRTSVQLYAANSQVREAMQQNLDQLRQQLAQRLGAEQSLQLDVRDQAQQQSKQHSAVATQIAAQLADDAAELNSAAAVQQTTGWLDRLV
ncbi:flagellar hook-length control protein FliK [Rheinheimera sp.]|uniref:flagellar hook-length control protein FliK n=1 Tax=Rheinheimera sp. TaxID=1869214 RepID=UPI00273383E0|nr:flagellar hook-length control protein FliK [Rheinheimera sp.]MDP2716682.1 flagellar hook-length control protein FliK [Rheinheimera sp.]